MGKIAIVFPGQGAQNVGMGQKFYETSPGARRVFDQADALRPGTTALCFTGDAAALMETKNTQPCLFAMELAAAAALTEAGLEWDMTAGFSLGELTALTWAGTLEFDTAFRLVCRRGELMQRAAEQSPTFMAAVMKLDNAAVEALCGEFSQVWPVNFNCPGQVTVAGASEEFSAFSARVRTAGGRALPLKVRGAFHSPFMREASEAFAQELSGVAFQSPKKPVYANATAAPYGDAPEQTLERQMCSPVLWEKTVRNMIAAGVDRFLEPGPGRTLCNLIGKTDDTVRCFPISTPEELQEAMEQCGWTKPC